MTQEKRDFNPGDLLSGTLDIFGLKIDLGELVASPESLKDRLEELRERLKAAGGREVLADDEWRAGGATVSGHIRTHGVFGEQEYHIGTVGKGRPGRKPAPQPVEPPIDVFDEDEEVVVIADVPGVSRDDLELKVEGSTLFISARPTAPRSYRKELLLGAELQPESLQATCNNGVLEVRLRKRKKGDG